MKVKLINRIEHRNVPGLSSKQRDELKLGKVVDVKQESADFLLEYKYVEEVADIKPKVKKDFTFNTEAEIDG